MQVRDGMSKVILSIGPAHTLREAASLMTKRKVGSAVVLDSDRSGIGILTERDILDAIGMGQNPDTELAAAHLTGDLVFATPTWTLEQAAEAMTRGGFRHLIVIDQNEVVGMISVRDIVRCWVEQAASPSGQLVG